MNLNQLINQIIQQMLSGVPGGPLLSGFSPALGSWLSPGSSMDNKFIWPGMDQSVRNAASSYLNTIYTQSFNSSASALAEEQKIRGLTEYVRLMHPDKSHEELRGMAINMSNNPFNAASMLYSSIDPYGMSAGLAEAGNLSSALLRRGSRGLLAGAEYASQVSSVIYDKDSGIIRDILNNPGQYGNLSVSGVMSIGRELAMTDPRGFVGSDGSFNADRFKQRLSTMSKALEPWTDIFGKDIPKLMSQLEALTGQSVGSIGAVGLENMGYRMAGVLDATGAKIQHLAGYSQVLSGALAGSDFSTRNIMSSASVATDMLLGLSNLSIHTMTNQELQQFGGMYYTGTAKSKLSDHFALAYAKWQANTPGGTLEQFQGLYDEAIRGGAASQTALLSIAGASSMSDLESYRYTNGFMEAVRAGSGARASRSTIIHDSISRVADMYKSTGFTGYNSAVYDRISAMNPEELTRFMALTPDEKKAQLRVMLPGMSEDEYQTVANDLAVSMSRSMTSVMDHYVDREQARVIIAQDINFIRQQQAAKNSESFRRAVTALSTPGGFRSVLDMASREGKNANVSDLIKGYSGGVDVLDALLNTMGIGGVDGGNEVVYRQGLNFALNNYGSLATDYEDIYKLMMSKDSGEQLKGYRIAAELNSLGAKTLSKLSTSERENLLASVYEADLGGTDSVGKFIKNKYMDMRVTAGISAVINEGKLKDTNSAKALSDLINSKDQYSVEQLKEQAKSLNINEDDVNSVIRASKIGDIDGVDPIHKLAGILENMAKGLNQLVDKFVNGPDKK